MGKKRITKKQLKEDAFVSATFEAGHFVQQNMGKIIAGIVGVLAITGIVFLFINYRAERSGEASVNLLRAESLYMNGQYALAAADFEKVAEDFSGTGPGKKAVYFAGDSYFKAGEFERALSLFQECREILSQDAPLMVNCLFGIAAAHEELENMETAVKFYREALAVAGYDFEKIEVMSSLSRALMMSGKNAEALELLNRIIQDYPDNPRKDSFIELRAELLAKASGSAQGG